MTCLVLWLTIRASSLKHLTSSWSAILARPNKIVRHVTQATGLYDSQNRGLALCQRTIPSQDVSHTFRGLTTQRAPHLAHQTCIGLLNHIIIIIIIITTASSSSSRGTGTGSGSGSDSSRIVKVVNIVFLSRVENGALNWWKWSKGTRSVWRQKSIHWNWYCGRHVCKIETRKSILFPK